MISKYVPGAAAPILGTTEGLEPSYRHSWFLPPSVTVLLLLVVLCLVAFLYWRERGKAGFVCRVGLTSLRMGLVSLVLFMLYGWVQQSHVTDLADVVVLIDDSLSMGLKDQQGDDDALQSLRQPLKELGLTESDRLSVAKVVLLQEDARLLQQLESRYHVKIFRVGRTVRPFDETTGSLVEDLRGLEAGEDSSRLGDALRHVLDLQRGRPTAAIIVMTDGITTAGPSLGEASKYSRRMGIPLHILGIGNARPVRDVRVSDLFVESVVFVDDLLHFDFTLSASGFVQQEVVVQLRQAGASQPLAQRTLKIDTDEYTSSQRFSFRPQDLGDFVFTIVAEAKGEIDEENNTESREVRVTDETIRVLLVQEYPSYEFRALKDLLSRGVKQSGTVVDRSIELTTILQEADLQHVELDSTAESTFPVNREELYAYDVVIFGDVNPKLLSESAIQNLSDFVIERGGGLVLLAGPRHLPLAYWDTPLGELFPMEMASTQMPRPDELLNAKIQVQLSRIGQVSPHMQLVESVEPSARAWKRLPELRWLLGVSRVGQGVRVLLEHPAVREGGRENLPVICLQFVGAGKVVFHATDETWRWLGNSSGAPLYERYWLQTIRYLSRSKLLGKSRQAEITVDREEFQQGDVVPLQVRFFDDRLAPARDDGVTVVVDRNQGNRRKMSLRRETGERGLFVGSAGALPEGRYRAWLATPTLDGEPPATVFRVARPDQELTRKQMDVADLRLAARVSRGQFYSLSQLDQLLESLPIGKRVRIQSQPEVPLWNNCWLALLFLVLLTGEWLVRKRVGML